MSTELTTPDDVSQTLAKFKPAELLEVLAGLKKHADQNAAQVRTILEQNPDLTYAILQSLFLMGLVDERVIGDAMQASHISASQSSVGADSPSSPQTLSNPAPTAAASPKAVSPPPAAAPSMPSVEERLRALDPQQAAMIRQVLALTESQIAQLPVTQQQQIHQLRQAYQ